MKRSQETKKQTVGAWLCIIGLGLASLLLVLGFLAIPMHAQTSNTFNVIQFRNNAADGTVGAMTTLAQAACNPVLNCIIIFDPILNSFPQGTMPLKCANCAWIDYRVPGAYTVTPTNVKIQNQIRWVDQYAGATADIKIAACLADGGAVGTCDAHGFGCTVQSLAATTTVNTDQTLLFDPCTKFQAASSALNLFIIEPNAIVKGFTFDCGNQPSYSGFLFQNDTTRQYPNGNKMEVSDVTTSANCSTVTAGAALKLNSTSVSLGVSFATFKHWRIWGLGDGVFFTSSSTGFVNGVHMSDMVVSNSPHGWHLTNGGGQIQGDLCYECSYEKDSTGINGVLIDGAGTGNIDGFQFFGDIWDTTAGNSVLITNAQATKNVFFIRGDGSHTDNAGNTNNFIELAPSSSPGFWELKGVKVKTTSGGSSTETFSICNITAAGTAPCKWFRVTQTGALEMLNDAFASAVFSVSNTGAVAAAGGLSVGGGTSLSSMTLLTVSLTPVSVAAASSAEQALGFTGVAASDNCAMVNHPAQSNAAAPVSIRVTGANTIAVTYINPSAGAVVPPSGSYTLLCTH
jgi:hypothetical protein